MHSNPIHKKSNPIHNGSNSSALTSSPRQRKSFLNPLHINEALRSKEFKSALEYVRTSRRDQEDEEAGISHEQEEWYTWYVYNAIVATILSFLTYISFLLDYALKDHLHGNEWLNGMWIAISGIIVFQDSNKHTFYEAFNRTLGTIIGCISAGIALSFINITTASESAHLACTLWGAWIATLFCVFSRFIRCIRVAALTSSIVVAVSLIDPAENAWSNVLARFIDSMLGICLAVIAQMLSEYCRQKLYIPVSQIANSIRQSISNNTYVRNSVSTIRESLSYSGEGRKNQGDNKKIDTSRSSVITRGDDQNNNQKPNSATGKNSRQAFDTITTEL